MKKFLKIILLILINIIIFLILLIFTDVIIYKTIVKQQPIHTINLQDFSEYLFKELEIKRIPTKGFFSGEYKHGRLPDGLEYKNKKPIVIFGCSFAYGDSLNDNQTFSYKLAHLLKRPVYNRACSGYGIQQMYMQSMSNYFYEEVPDSDTYIYVIIDHHYYRMFGEPFSFSDGFFYAYFIDKNGKFTYANFKNPIINFFRASYLLRIIRIYYVEHFINNPQNADKLTDRMLAYFVQSRENIEKRLGHKVKFYVFFYQEICYTDLLISKLKQNDFDIIYIRDLTEEDLSSTKYTISPEDEHPNEAVWNLVTPKIAKIISKNDK